MSEIETAAAVTIQRAFRKRLAEKAYKPLKLSSSIEALADNTAKNLKTKLKTPSASPANISKIKDERKDGEMFTPREKELLKALLALPWNLIHRTNTGYFKSIAKEKKIKSISKLKLFSQLKGPRLSAGTHHHVFATLLIGEHYNTADNFTSAGDYLSSTTDILFDLRKIISEKPELLDGMWMATPILHFSNNMLHRVPTIQYADTKYSTVYSAKQRTTTFQDQNTDPRTIVEDPHSTVYHGSTILLMVAYEFIFWLRNMGEYYEYLLQNIDNAALLTQTFNTLFGCDHYEVLVPHQLLLEKGYYKINSPAKHNPQLSNPYNDILSLIKERPIGNTKNKILAILDNGCRLVGPSGDCRELILEVLQLGPGDYSSAMRMDAEEIVNILVNGGLNHKGIFRQSVIDINSWDYLLEAIHKNNPLAVAILLKNGANPNIQSRCSRLVLKALAIGNSEIARLLIAYRIDLTSLSEENASAFEKLASLHHTGKAGEVSPKDIYRAIQDKNLNRVDELLEHTPELANGDTTIYLPEKCTPTEIERFYPPLHYAIHLNADFSIIKSLAKAGANMSEFVTIPEIVHIYDPDHYGRIKERLIERKKMISPLSLALQNINFNLAQYLLDQGALISCQELETGNTLLHFLCSSIRQDDAYILSAINFVIKNKAEIDIRNNQDQTSIDILFVQYKNSEKDTSVRAVLNTLIEKLLSSQQSSFANQKRGEFHQLQQEMIEKDKIAMFHRVHSIQEKLTLLNDFPEEQKISQINGLMATARWKPIGDIVQLYTYLEDKYIIQDVDSQLWLFNILKNNSKALSDILSNAENFHFIFSKLSDEQVKFLIKSHSISWHTFLLICAHIELYSTEKKSWFFDVLLENKCVLSESLSTVKNFSVICSKLTNAQAVKLILSEREKIISLFEISNHPDDNLIDSPWLFSPCIQRLKQLDARIVRLLYNILPDEIFPATTEHAHFCQLAKILPGNEFLHYLAQHAHLLQLDCLSKITTLFYNMTDPLGKDQLYEKFQDKIFELLFSAIKADYQLMIVHFPPESQEKLNQKIEAYVNSFKGQYTATQQQKSFYFFRSDYVAYLSTKETPADAFFSILEHAQSKPESTTASCLPKWLSRSLFC